MMSPDADVDSWSKLLSPLLMRATSCFPESVCFSGTEDGIAGISASCEGINGRYQHDTEGEKRDRVLCLDCSPVTVAGAWWPGSWPDVSAHLLALRTRG